MVNRCVRKSFSIVLDAIVEITIGASALLSESPGRTPSAFVTPGALKRAGLITVARGTGGAELARTPKEITLLDIYQAVESTNLDDVIGIHEAGITHAPWLGISRRSQRCVCSSGQSHVGFHEGSYAC